MFSWPGVHVHVGVRKAQMVIQNLSLKHLFMGKCAETPNKLTGETLGHGWVSGNLNNTSG